DRAGGVARPVLEIQDVNWTLVNDPLQVIAFQGDGRSPLGPVKWTGSLRRDQGPSPGVTELPDFHLTQPPIRALVKPAPELAEYVKDSEARGNAKLELRYQPGGRPALRPDLQVTLTEGWSRHPKLPRPLDSVSAKVRYHDDVVTVERCEAK